MSISSVAKELKKLDKEQLADLLLQMHKRSKDAKAILEYFAEPDEEKLLKNAAEQMHEAFFPTRGWRVKLRKGKDCIAQAKMVGASTETQLEIMLLYVCTGLERDKKSGYVGKAFYSSLVSVFKQALALAEKEYFGKIFAARFGAAVATAYSISSPTADEMAGLLSAAQNKEAGKEEE